MGLHSFQTSVQGESFYREFVQQNIEGIYRIDFDAPIPTNSAPDEICQLIFERGLIGEFNQSFARTFEPFGQVAKPSRLDELKDFLPFFEESNVRNFCESGYRIDNLETVLRTDDGETKFYTNSLFGVLKNENLVCIWGNMRDVTEDKIVLQNAFEVEKHLRLTNKIEALGRLAGGIAHDFNNFLAVMMLQNDMLNLQLPAGSPLRHRIEEMKKATAKATAMVKQLLAVGRKQAIHPKPTEINAIVREFEKNLPAILNDKIKIETNLDPQAGVCFIDAERLILSLSGLAANASDAMPDGGTLTISTSNVVLDKSSVLHESQPEGSFVQITVADTGTGMDANVLECVFEPFFSTKKSAKGVGLGLATVYGFVKQSKGFIWVESELERGTTFCIQFPRIDQPVVQ